MGARPHNWSDIRDSANAQQIEQDLVRLRSSMLERHDINVPIDDPICLEFTMYSHILERTVLALQLERRETVEELRSLLHSTNYAVRMTLEDAGKPLAKAMADTFDPRTVADRIMAEVFDDLRRECRAAVREARRVVAIAMGVTLAASFLVLYFASERLASAQALFHLADGGSEVSNTLPPPYPDDPSRERN